MTYSYHLLLLPKYYLLLLLSFHPRLLSSRILGILITFLITRSSSSGTIEWTHFLPTYRATPARTFP